jgi:Tol biopolymer transport system component
MSYQVRIAGVSVLLGVLTVLIIWWGPAVRDVTVVARSPDGQTVSVGAPIRISFSRPVDRAAVEQQFRLDPPAEGSFFWEGQQLTFRPSPPLHPTTTYTVTLTAGLRDAEGRANREPIGWSFTTRSPRLLVATAASDVSSRLLLIDPQTSEAQPLRDPGARLTQLAPAPGGTEVLYTLERPDGRYALWLFDLEQETTRALLDEPGSSVAAPAWSPLGNLLAYELLQGTTAPREPAGIWLAQPDGTSLGPLYADAARLELPVWSPDGRMLAFFDAADDTIGIFDFTTERRSFPAAVRDAASWSPASRALVYTAADADDARSHLRHVDLATGATRALTDGTQTVGSPAWAPDDAWIVYVAEHADGSNLELVRPDGSARQPLTAPAAQRDMQPRWSPDSRFVAFLRRNADGTTSAWLADPDNGAARELFSDASAIGWLP